MKQINSKKKQIKGKLYVSLSANKFRTILENEVSKMCKLQELVGVYKFDTINLRPK